jgi:hypothetical protein
MKSNKNYMSEVSRLNCNVYRIQAKEMQHIGTQADRIIREKIIREGGEIGYFKVKMNKHQMMVTTKIYKKHTDT